MSRKKAEKRNLKIGIFTDKSKQYNLAILEALYERGTATTWQIAKTLQHQLKFTQNKQAATYRTQNIYGVIQRKGGRLQDLEEKGYILCNEGLWSIHIKGRIALGIQRPDLLERESESYGRWFLKSFKETVEKIPEGIAKAPLGITIDRGLYRKDMTKLLESFTRNPQVFKIFVDETKELLLSGIDLDRIDEYTLAALLMARKRIRKIIRRKVKELS